MPHPYGCFRLRLTLALLPKASKTTRCIVVVGHTVEFGTIDYYTVVVVVVVVVVVAVWTWDYCTAYCFPGQSFDSEGF